MKAPKLFDPILTNYAGHIVPGLITRVYDDNAVDAHIFAPHELNLHGDTTQVPGLRHAGNEENPKAKAFVFNGEDIEPLLEPPAKEPEEVQENADFADYVPNLNKPDTAEQEAEAQAAEEAKAEKKAKKAAKKKGA